MAKIAKIRACLGQEPGDSCGSLMWVADARALGPSYTDFFSNSKEAGSEMEKPKHVPAYRALLTKV